MRTILLGLDSFDPRIFEHLLDQGKMQNLAEHVDLGGYSRLEVCSPPQTEVSWTSIATGLDPGGHGIFDFVHREPLTYAPYVSLLLTKKSIFGEQFLPPHNAKTIFTEVTEMGYPAIVMWWPAMFPARPGVPVATLPGLGTPDLSGKLGVGTFFSSEPEPKKKVRVTKLESNGRNRFAATLEGPQIKARSGARSVGLPLSLEIIDDAAAELVIDSKALHLRLGEWSPIFEVKFKAVFGFSIYAITQAILTELKGRVSLYLLPLQIHPMHSVWHYATPRSFVEHSWVQAGPFLTLGWPQDTNALEDGCINDDQFLRLCDSIFESRERVFNYHLERFQEGILAGIFDCLDRVQHMFLRDRIDIVHEWYIKLDRFVGRVKSAMKDLGLEKGRFLVLSDHGFQPFYYKAHLNYWLVEHGYLVLRDDAKSGEIGDIDWSKTRAYALGLNSVYLNISGREGRGIVELSKIEEHLFDLKTKLLDWKGPDGKAVISRVLLNHEAFSGPNVKLGPDLVIGYTPGYRASSETGLGKVPSLSMEVNADHWGADHCMDAPAVPGVIITNRNLQDFPAPSFRDIPFLAIGKHLSQSYIKPPSMSNLQGQKDLEERLKGLGYL